MEDEHPPRTEGQRKLTPGEEEALSKLCYECQTFFRSIGNPRVDLPLHASTIQDPCELKLALQEGCHLCTVVLDKVSSSEQSDALRKLWYTESPHIEYTESISVRIDRESNPINHLSKVSPKQHSPALQFSASTNTEENWQLARKWLETCLADHACSFQSEHRKMPTRLLHVGLPGDLIYLCITGSLSNTVQYATLSHCWGTSSVSVQNQDLTIDQSQIMGHATEYVMPTLRQDNIEEMMKNIPFDTLSKTFQEAIQAARCLGFQYLWIDSLCIIQDSVDDWAKESVTMCDIYSGSSVNIAATASKNGAEGCFRDRTPDRVKPCKIGVKIEKDGQDVWNSLQNNAWENLVENSPLCRRAWVVQERILAPRTLHFGETQMFWECNNFAACESSPDGSECLSIKKTVRSFPGSVWQLIVELYCKASLTYTSDKLVAIAGIAKFVQTLDHRQYDDYFAGLWRESIEKQMMWTVREGPIRKPVECRPASYRAPTWSWASIDGPVLFRPFGNMPRSRIPFKVTEVRVVPSTQDKFGSIEHGTLNLHCLPLKSTRLSFESDDGKFKLDGISVPSGLLRMDVKLSSDWQDTVVNLMATLCSADKQSPTGEKIVCCLILAPTGKCKGEYQRLGILDLADYYADSKHFREAPDLLDESAYEHIEREENRETKYFITIV